MSPSKGETKFYLIIKIFGVGLKPGVGWPPFSKGPLFGKNFLLVEFTHPNVGAIPFLGRRKGKFPLPM